MKQCQYKGQNFIQLEEGENIELKPFHFGAEVYQVGEIIESLGRKKRTSLKYDEPMIYFGQYDGYVLLGFEAKEKNFFIAPAIVNNDVLLMQSSESGFYDIRF